MKNLKIRLSLLVLSSILLVGCGKKADRTTINHITNNEVLDEYDLENLNEMFYSQCRGIYNKINPESEKAKLINNCVNQRMKPFLEKYKK